MGCTGGQESGKAKAEGPAAPDFTEFCQGEMPAGIKERCGSQMREMMARCLGHFQGEPKDTDETAEKEA